MVPDSLEVLSWDLLEVQVEPSLLGHQMSPLVARALWVALGDLLHAQDNHMEALQDLACTWADLRRWVIKDLVCLWEDPLHPGLRLALPRPPKDLWATLPGRGRPQTVPTAA